MALGMTLIYSVMGILNFTHGALYMLGGYVIYYSIILFGLPYYVGLVFAFVFVGLLGVLIYKGLLRYFRTEILVCLIITVGLSGIFENSAYIVFNPYEKSVPSLISSVVKGPLGVSLSAERLIVMFIGLALVSVFLLLINYSKPGRALRAVAEDAEASMLQGVNAESTFTLGMFLASGLAGIAGGLMAPVFGIGPFIGLDVIMNSFTIILIGGVGSISGALVGSFVLGLITSVGNTFFSGDVATMISFALLILIMVVRPRGLLGGI
jgi:branched-chain amino acid transport system permease protein